MKTVVACLAVACLFAGGAVAGRLTAPLQPPCLHPLYGADGTMGPIFCVVDNPLALYYYAKLGAHLLALGQDATPRSGARSRPRRGPTFDRADPV